MGDGHAFRFQPPVEAADGHYDIYFFPSELMVTTRRLRSVAEWHSSDHGDHHLCFCFHLSGQRQVQVENDRLYRLSEPSFVAFYQPVDQPKHMIWRNGETELSVTIAFSPDLLQREFGLHAEDLPLLLQSFLPGRERPSFLWLRGPLLQHMHTAARALAEPDVIDACLLPAYVKAKASELLCLGLQAGREMWRSEEPAPARYLSPRYVAAAREARRLLEADCVGRLSIQALARSLQVDAARLCAAFRATMGETIFDYGNRARMERARRLLGEAGLSIKQISHAVGFSQPAAFAVAFKRFSGLSPKSYRQSAGRRATAPDHSGGG